MRIMLLLALASTLLAGRRDGAPEPEYLHRPRPEANTPEPGTVGLMGAGLIALMVARNWRAK